MEFFTRYNFKSKSEKLSSANCELFDDAGYIPLERRIENLINAGERLEETRRAMFPGFDDEEIDIDDPDIEDMDHIEREALFKEHSQKMKKYMSMAEKPQDLNPRASESKIENTSDVKESPKGDSSEKKG